MKEKKDAYAAAIRGLWTGRCTVTVRENETDPKTGRNMARLNTVYRDEPCLLTYETVKTTEVREGAAEAGQSVTLFAAPSLCIPPGSQIEVTQNGICEAYEQSGKPAVYSHHQEIPLVACKEWA